MSHEMTPTCACCAPAPLRSGQGLNRRGFLNFGAAGVAGTALATLPPMMMSFMSESRRLSNVRMKRELGMGLRYPTVREGLAVASG